jgi:hypothetical protein
LHDLLTGSGYDVDFVGSQSNGVAYPFSDPQHEGHNGQTDAFIASNIYNWLSLYAPDVVLLHIGTNTPRDPDQVMTILDEIDNYEIDFDTDVIVIMARIIKKGGNPGDPLISEYNDILANLNTNPDSGLVPSRADYGSELFVVDMEDGAGIKYWSYTDTIPGDMMNEETLIHPYATGYSKMADVWKAKFDEIYASCGTNDPPDVTPVEPPPPDYDEGETIVPLQIEASDPDGDPLTYSAVNLPDGLSIDPNDGDITGELTNSAAENSPYPVQVTVSDGKPLGSTTIGFDWEVNYINLSPSLQNPGNQSHAEGDPVSLDLNASDLDNDSLTFSAVNLPQGLTIDQNTDQITGTIGYMASSGSPHEVEVTVADDGSPSLEDSVSFTWTVANTNRAPDVSVPENQSNKEGDIIDPLLQIVASDPDGDNLNFKANNLPLGLSIDENTGEISGMISHLAVMGMSSKDFLVEIIVTDIADSPIDETVYFTWKVNNVNGPPVMVNPGNQFNQVDEIISLQINTTDPDEDAYQFAEKGLPPSLVIGKNTGVISGKLAEIDAQSGPYIVTITATDDGTPKKSSQINFIWVVTTGEIYLPMIFR